jgi:ABC-type polysaccharide/polyol phosphate export permease
MLVSTNIKKKYQGSILGVLWSLLNPLAQAIILTIIFSALFKDSIANFPVYLLSGRLFFDFFASASQSSTNSLRNSASLMRKVYIPKYIFVLSVMFSNFVDYLIAFFVLIIVMIVTGASISIYILYIPIYIALLFIFTLGTSLIMSTLSIFFKDVEYLYSIIITLLMYLSAIFYPPEIIPDNFKLAIEINPIYQFIKGFRQVIYYNQSPDLSNIIICCAIAVSFLILGLWVFKKNQDKFILYI